MSGAYSISPNHPLFVENRLLGNVVPGMTPVAPSLPTGGAPAAPTTGSAGDGDRLTFSRATLESRLSTFERNSTDPNASSLASAMRALLLN